VSEERSPVSFRAAKPVDKKTRHPFSGQPIGETPMDPTIYMPPTVAIGDSLRGRDPPTELVEVDPSVRNHPVSPYNLVLDDLRRKRDEIDKAIRLIESLR
jgi:hypothetical protein